MCVCRGGGGRGDYKDLDSFGYQTVLQVLSFKDAERNIVKNS